ncbi:recombination protein NinB [Janthinobacterium sp. GB4P2]|uniref:recombination protein NinB n=1 Tax=Janthinobacterium sp. GB4P2 TaxID=3424189 RepID=UPI003F24DA24
MKREKFEQRRIRLVGAQQLATALALLPHLPLDADKPLELLIREEVKGRKLDQNALMWAGPLRDIAEQCWIEGRQHSAEVWHEYFKAQFLPEQFDLDLCKSEKYQKWDFGPGGDRVLVASSTDLTIKGFAQYLDQIHAFGGQMGVEFHEAPQRG